MNVSTFKTTFGRTGLMALVSGLLFVFAVGCGDDDTNANNGTTNNGTVDAGDTGGEDTGADVADADGDTAIGDAADADDDATQCVELDLPDAECDPNCQTGCQAGEYCAPGRPSASEPLTATCETIGTGGQDEACDDGCQEGFGCFGTAGDAVCQEICRPSEGDSACSTAGTVCAPIDDEIDFGSCVVPVDECDIFPPTDSCGDGQNCYETNLGTRCLDFDATATAGDACDPDATTVECGDLQTCASDDNGGVCVDLCDPDATDNRCDVGVACTAFENNADRGFCALPTGT